MNKKLKNHTNFYKITSDDLIEDTPDFHKKKFSNKAVNKNKKIKDTPIEEKEILWDKDKQEFYQVSPCSNETNDTPETQTKKSTSLFDDLKEGLKNSKKPKSQLKPLLEDLKAKPKNE